VRTGFSVTKWGSRSEKCYHHTDMHTRPRLIVIIISRKERKQFREKKKKS